MIKQEKTQYNLAQQNPKAFFQELKHRLVAYQNKNRMIDDDPVAILDHQIAKTIDDVDNYLFQSSINPFKRYDSGVGTDSSEKFVYLTFDHIVNFLRFLEIMIHQLMSSGIHHWIVLILFYQQFLIFKIN